MKANFKKVKTGVFGIQGSGKTYFAEYFLIRQFKKPFVYLLHPEDFTSCKSNVTVYIPKKMVKGKLMIDRSPEHLDKIMGLFVEKAKKGEYDAFILDEASTFLPKNYQTLQKYDNLIDAIDNHRHYGKKKGEGFAFIYMARRPQAITTEITETSENLVIFAIDGVNVKDYFNHIYDKMGEEVAKLEKEKHNFILKELGKPPKILKAIKSQETNKHDKARKENNLTDNEGIAKEE